MKFYIGTLAHAMRVINTLITILSLGSEGINKLGLSGEIIRELTRNSGFS